MRAILLHDQRYEMTEVPAPQPQAGEVVLKVAYAGVNRADLFQKQGRYPLPARGVPGLEVSGEIVALGESVTGWQLGEAACALLSEGGFAKQVAAPAALLFPVSGRLGLREAAALPEACMTAWVSLVEQCALQPGERALIHGGSSGVGLTMIQIAAFLGAEVFTTAGSEAKCEACLNAGAKRAIFYKNEDFVEVLRREVPQGIDVLVDMVGGDYFSRNLQVMAKNGRISIIAFMGGAKTQAHLGPILLNHLTIRGTTLRSRSLVEKTRFAEALRARLWDGVLRGDIAARVDSEFSLEDAESALMRMEQGLNIGKILLRVA